MESLSMVILPKGSSMPLHNQPGRVQLKVIYGEIIVRHMKISTIESNQQLAGKGYTQQYDLSVDGFAGEDDCVCRGGKCPRRWGCDFWVEKLVQDQGAYYIAQLDTIANVNAQSSRELSFEFGSGPREYTSLEEPSAVLELFTKEEELASMETVSIPDQILYHRSSSLLDSNGQVSVNTKITSSSTPMGYGPMYTPYFGPGII
jgi:hypothetical protein